MREHLVRVLRVLELLNETDSRIYPAMLHLAAPMCEYLGYTISPEFNGWAPSNSAWLLIDLRVLDSQAKLEGIYPLQSGVIV